MDDARLIEEGLAGRLPADSAEFQRFVEITARRPSGEAGAAHYRDPKEHEESFAIALGALELTAADRYLELCFGGGQLLEQALETAASAAGIDHSPDMVALARERNAAAVAAGRLELVEGDVHELPWTEAEFTCSACLNAFFFIERPTDFLAEVRRVLAPSGRFVLITARSVADSSGGPWNPALRRYEPSALRTMLLDAGFREARVDEDADSPQVAVARA
ncbi:MAG TPA: class I SAM-dependent methyltransferase [Gaiellaceae bacterium]|nr:class I SAM-dependent methyltransferase [Gaiellaceae bacterium]